MVRLPTPELAMPARLLRLHLIDDHPVLVEGLTMALEATGRFRVTGTTTHAGDAAVALDTTDADVVVLDLSLGSRNGLDLLQRALLQRPDLRVLVFSAQDAQRLAEPALRVGACGYLHKSATIAEVVRALETVAQGDVYVSESTTQHLLRHHGPAQRLKELSSRQITVLQAFTANGHVDAVAAQLNISPRTVESHVHNICQKLGLDGIEALRHFASRWYTPSAA